MTTIEIESKLELDQDDFSIVKELGTIEGIEDQLNVYFDSSGMLADQASTFRVRIISGRPESVLTLKLPKKYRDEKRWSCEIESLVSKNTWSLKHKTINVENDLTPEYSEPLKSLGISKLNRIGWMRTKRLHIRLLEEVVIDLDIVRLPGGRTFFEVEVEETRDDFHAHAVQMIKTAAKSARPSILSKYQRFASAIEEENAKAANA